MGNIMNYIKLLKESAISCGNCACMGLDPVASLIPTTDKDGKPDILCFFRDLFIAMKKASLKPSAFKPNIGYYTIYDKPFEGDFSGSIALAKTLCLIREYFGNIPIILDAKRGDIATSSLNYATEAFDVWKADCTTVSPYMGHDSIEPFIEGSYKDKGIYLLNRTSNKGAGDFQNLYVKSCYQVPSNTELNSESNENYFAEKEMPLYLNVSKKIAFYAKKGFSVGAVVGATSMEELKEIANFFVKEGGSAVPLLIPGVGSQGGSAKDVIASLRECEYDISVIRINSSSNLTHPWKKSGKIPSNYIDECVSNIFELIQDCKI